MAHWASAADRHVAIMEYPMPKLHNLYLALLVLAGTSVPLAAYTGYCAPTCTWSTVWTLTGYHYQYVRF